MDEGIRMYIAIECDSVELKKCVGEHIHNQLRGNSDYIDNNIILNIDDPYSVQLWVYEECVDIPKITLPDLHFRTMQEESE